jgi:hypothetical protein
MSSGTIGALDEHQHLSLCETLDRVLNKGVVIAGEVLISVADVDLIYLGLQVVLTSVETARQYRQAALYAGAGTGAAGEARG